MKKQKKQLDSNQAKTDNGHVHHYQVFQQFQEMQMFYHQQHGTEYTMSTY